MLRPSPTVEGEQGWLGREEGRKGWVAGGGPKEPSLSTSPRCLNALETEQGHTEDTAGMAVFAASVSGMGDVK